MGIIMEWELRIHQSCSANISAGRNYRQYPRRLSVYGKDLEGRVRPRHVILYHGLESEYMTIYIVRTSETRPDTPDRHRNSVTSEPIENAPMDRRNCAFLSAILSIYVECLGPWIIIHSPGRRSGVVR